MELHRPNSLCFIRPAFPNILLYACLTQNHNHNHFINMSRIYFIISLDEGENFLGMSMTYSLFEYVKENFESLVGKCDN